MHIPVLDGIHEEIITSERISTRVLMHGYDDGVPVIFLHGNISSATWWEEVLITLPSFYWGIAYDQRGFGAADAAKKIDAWRGMGDLSDDLTALMDALDIDEAHIIASSMGGNVLWQFLMDHPTRVISAVQVAPGSPYGFGGTRGIDGTPVYTDYAGSGAGIIGWQFVAQLQAHDRSDILFVSPRRYLRRLWGKAHTPFRIEELLSSTLSTHLGEQAFPGDFVRSPNWPYFAPGRWGVINALSPAYQPHPSRLYESRFKPPILWIRGNRDASVSNQSHSDYAFLGQQRMIRGYPGREVYPPQPMVDQTRAVLDAYHEHGGIVKEVVMRDLGHVPYIERLGQFNDILHPFLNTHTWD